MTPVDIAGLAIVGLLAGVTSGMIGVGGGVVFVPGLVLFADLGQVSAESTSLFAVIAVAIVGAWRQHGYGNLRIKEGVLVGVLSVLGVIVGVELSNAVPERALQVGFAILQVYFAFRLVKKARGEESPA